MTPPKKRSVARTLGRVGLGLALVFAGVSHLTFARDDFKAQVPDFAKELAPKGEDQVVVGSGIAEIALGLSFLVLPKHKKAVGTIAAVFFTAIFPGNLSQWVNRRSAFGLDTDGKRFGRLFFQPLLVAWALWSTRSPR
ncbi:hypothetical protein ACEXQD_02660 [Herbiconiux sp. P15]|uniref:DoxX family protein n=1 Tax=Herbiconiux liukaitaii TaxID=3342799 RepID=UPI0035BB70E5